MTYYDMTLIVLTVAFDLCALRLATRAFTDPCGMSELQSAIVGFGFIFAAVALSYYSAVKITQSTHDRPLMKTHENGHTYSVPNRRPYPTKPNGMYRTFESPSNTFGDGQAKMWRM